jgi:hypothetical protein
LGSNVTSRLFLLRTPHSHARSTLTTAATVSSISFIVADPSAVPVENAYNWSIYATAKGLPTGAPGPTLGGNPTVLPVISGEAFKSNVSGIT